MIYLQFAGLVLVCLGTLCGLVRCFHMLQQNSYKTKRYMMFGKTADKGRLIVCLLVAALLLPLAWWVYPAFLGIGFVVSFLRFAKNKIEQAVAIKPLVYTARVKRQFTTALVLLAAVCVLWFVFPALRLLFVGIALLLYAVTPAFALVVLWLNAPLEKAVAQHYINHAKRILKKSPHMKILGVTGSYGKTTTKFIITRLLSEKYTVTVTPESFNTPMGVVRTIREKMKSGTEIFVVEMGAKRVGDIKEICDLVHPTYGVITSVGPQHLDTFHTIENIVKTKFELADTVERAKGRLYLNCDSQLVAQNKRAGAICYGTDPACQAYVTDLTCHEGGSAFTVHYQEECIPVTTRLLGSHNILNITVAVAVARDFDVPVSDIQYAVSTLKPTEHRLEVKSFIGGATMIDDAYNANPEGCLEAVNVLGRFANKKKIIVTPGLVELGEKEAKFNFDLGVRAGQVCDQIVLVGLNRSKPIADGVRSTDFCEENLHIVASFKDAVALLSPTLDQNCVVLVENDLPDNYLY